MMLERIDQVRPNVLLICGSTSTASKTRVLLRALEATLIETMDVAFWDLAAEPLPIADPSFHRQPMQTPNAAARKLITAVSRADAIALASPLYHGSYSGVLKNALDHLGWDAFRHKPIALLSHGANATRCAQPVEHLQSIVRTLYGTNLQTQICTSNGDFGNAGDETIVASQDILSRLERLRDELARFIAAHRMVASA